VFARPDAGSSAQSTRSATGDLWSGVRSSGTSPLQAAEASGTNQGSGLGSGVAPGLAILGIGLAGLSGGLLVASARRRRAGSAARSSKTTER